MAFISLYNILLCFVCIAAFASFYWAVRSHFIDPKERSTGMRIIFVAGPASFLATLAAYVYIPVNAVQFTIALHLYAGSLALFWWAIASTRATQRLTFAFSKDQPTFLVTAGPYKLIRHPFYTSYLLFWAAGVAATGAWWLALILVGMMALYWVAARDEERKFAGSALASEYAAYASRTRMFLPWVF